MTPDERQQYEDWIERGAQWDAAHDAAIYGTPTEDAASDVPFSVLMFAPFAPHIDRLPRDPDEAAFVLHQWESARA